MNRKEFVFRDPASPDGLSVKELLTFHTSLPSDAKVINISADWQLILSAIVESASYPLTQPGSYCPKEDFYFNNPIGTFISHISPSAQSLNSHEAPFWGMDVGFDPSIQQNLHQQICNHVWKTYIGLGFTPPFNYCDTCGVKK